VLGKFYSYFLIVVLYSVHSIFALNIVEKELNQIESTDSNWSSIVFKNLSAMEYNITYSEKLGSFHSANKNNNLSFIYQSNGFSVKSVNNKSYIDANLEATDGSANFIITGYGRNGINENKFEGTVFNTENNYTFIEDNNM